VARHCGFRLWIRRLRSGAGSAAGPTPSAASAREATGRGAERSRKRLPSCAVVPAGGTYVPMDCFLAANWPRATPSQRPASLGMVTSRELAVVRAIQQGKSNKLIAYDLNMCESTVKVHVRSIMKKLKAKNRTEVAIKTSQLLTCPRCVTQGHCWSAGRCLKRPSVGSL
jgi:DNA-binding CsgD family transcriptional regulator